MTWLICARCVEAYYLSETPPSYLVVMLFVMLITILVAVIFFWDGGCLWTSGFSKLEPWAGWQVPANNVLWRKQMPVCAVCNWGENTTRITSARPAFGNFNMHGRQLPEFSQPAAGWENSGSWSPYVLNLPRNTSLERIFYCFASAHICYLLNEALGVPLMIASGVTVSVELDWASLVHPV